MDDNEDRIKPESEESIKEKVSNARQEYKELGGWPALKSGEWLSQLILKSFKNYWNNANVEYFENKYGTEDPGKIEQKLISVAARNSALLGAVVGAAISLDEILVLLSVLASGLGLPANIAIALSAIAGETFLLVRFQIQLICNLAKLHKVPLDPDDPEDILTILGFAFSGSASELAGKPVTKYGGKWLTAKVKLSFSGGRLKTAKNMGKPLGIKLLQRNIVKYILPIASIGIASTFNYWSTKSVAKVAKQKFKKRAAETKGESVPA